VSSTRTVPRTYKEDNWRNQVSFVWGSVKKRVQLGAAVERGLEPGSGGIGIVRSRTRQLLVKGVRAAKDL
jgi:hypothetical protein